MNPTRQPATGASAARIYQWLSGIAILLVLIQAVLAGRGWFIDADLIDIHGTLGSGTFLVVAGQAVAALFAWRRGLMGRLPSLLSIVLLVLVFAQLGLGYGSRDSGDAAAWHIPNGVLIFGLAVATFCLTLAPDRQRAELP